MSATSTTIIRFDHEVSLETPFRLYHFQGAPRNSASPPDIHYALHLGVLLDGRFESDYFDCRFANAPGDVWFTAPWEPHFARGLGYPTDIVLYAVLPEKLGDIGVASDINWLSPFIVPVADRPRVTTPALREKTLRLAREAADIHARYGERDPLGWLKLHEILLTLVRETGFAERVRSTGRETLLERLAPATRLARNATRETVSLEDAARACHLGKSRFSALFAEAMGMPFGKFAARARMGAVADAVRRSSAPFKLIAEEWGFYDESHFHRVFRRFFGSSPSAWRARFAALDVLPKKPD